MTLHHGHGHGDGHDRPLVRVAEPCLRAAAADDRARLGEFVSGLSLDSTYARFLTGMGGPPSERLLSALLPERPAGGAVVAFLDGELVGHALWARLPDQSVAEIAVVVADRHQRRGIGTALAAAVTDDLVDHGVCDVEVFATSDNRAVARMVTRAAPDARRELDGPTTTYSFCAQTRRGTLSQTA
jgi:GNAT superfamily N-acetyltransferase